ncbi:hypothetical protein LUZ62_045278 [Rhynchospora pubera]|uniref:Peptidase A1 domain-containing protein n=1 Tax=Rhynchospora pubera TaxID=906938 RepID=A0AAV8FL67_9POAL|nr:hypothetical protein LUZ62_045278 [Rhynchospora pubera]
MMQHMVSTLLLLLSLLSLSHSLPDGLRAELTHVDAGSNYTKLELLQRMVHRSKTRARFLASTNTDFSEDFIIPSFPSSNDNKTYHNEFLIKLSIGTPPQPFVLTLDTGSDLIWTQCQPLVHNFSQPYPFFNPKKSSTFFYTLCSFPLCNEIDIPEPQCSTQNLCMYNASYGDGSYTSGFLARETFTLGSTPLTNVFFGCGNDNVGVYRSNECGIAGFGRGTLSLISQLGYGQFAYCFTSFGESKSSPVLFGSTADLRRYEKGLIQSTPFFVNPIHPIFYYLYLKGITVGAMLLPIPPLTFAVKSDGSGGVIIDSGTAITSFPEAVFDIVTSAFISQVKLPVVKGDFVDLLCFSLPSASSQKFQPPKFIFHFEGADLELPPENYMHQEKQMACLAMSGDSGPRTVIGNFQQQNFHVLYDLVGEQLSFVPAQCDQL